jgi:biotin synthase
MQRFLMREKWTFEKAQAVFNQPFMDLLFEAQSVHRANSPKNTVQIPTLLNIKKGGCPENCAYCPQSVYRKDPMKSEPLMDLESILACAKKAKENGATRFCMGAAWRGPRDSDLEKVCEIIAEVKKLGLETCVTLGLLKNDQAKKLQESGLDFYNHDIDSSEEFYDKIITTRTFQDRLDTLENVRQSGIKVCCGGIIGMGETNEDRIRMLLLLANLETPPESIPINKLIRIPGTALANEKPVDPLDFIRIIALARILFPKSYVRLSAGRTEMSDEMQALCFMAGVNSIFHGEKLLITDNPEPDADEKLFERLGLEKMRFIEE